MQWLPLRLLTIVPGLLNPVQSGLTGALEKAPNRPSLVAVVSLSGSLPCALAGALVTRRTALMYAGIAHLKARGPSPAARSKSTETGASPSARLRV